MKKQRTIKDEVTFNGVGLHTGCKTTLRLKPAKANEGIRFVRVDLPGKPVIEAKPDFIANQSRLPRCTSIGKGDAVIHTVEHLMSVLSGLGINNLLVEIDGIELPGLDGSGLDYLKAIKKSGIVELSEEAPCFTITEPIGVQENDSLIYVVPSDQFKVSYTLHYNHPALKSQFVSFPVTEEIFEKEIAPCRTFCLEKEVQELQQRGLGKGANYQNTLVVGEKGVLDNMLRFPDEFVRHKVLDLIGDIYLLGMPIKGHIYALKSGHSLNLMLLEKIEEQRKKSQRAAGPSLFSQWDNKKEIDINGISKILPHRYPFLLVDRVLELEKGKKAIGIKNVTINDNFFQGHFPTRPIMPGVLMVEAMAQTGGVVVLTSEAHQGKVAFFLAADKVKFRKVVVPGDQLVMEVEVIKDKPRFAQVRAVSKVNGEIVAEADMVFSFTDKNYLDE